MSRWKKTSFFSLALYFSVFALSLNACKDDEKKESKKSKGKSSTRTTRRARAQDRAQSRGPSTASAKGFFEKFKLPPHADAVVFFDFAELKKHSVWKKLAPRLKNTPLVQAVKKSCNLEVFDIVDQAAFSVSYHSRDTLTILRGKNLDGKKVVACLLKAAADPKLGAGLKVTPVKGKAAGGKSEEGKSEEGKAAKAPRKGKMAGKSAAKKKARGGKKKAGGAHEKVLSSKESAKEPPSMINVTLTEGDVVIPARLTLLGKGQIAVAQGAWIGTAKALMAGKKPSLKEDSHLLKLRKPLGAANMFWALSLGLPPQIKNSVPSVAAIKTMRSIAFGVHGEGGALKMKVSADMRKAKSAKTLAGMLKRILPGLDKFNPALNKVAELLGKIQFSAEGPLLKLSLKLNQKDMDTLYATAKGLAPKLAN